MVMAETHPEYRRHMEERQQRMTTQDEASFDYPPAPRNARPGSTPPDYATHDRHYGGYPNAAEVVRAWRERNAGFIGEGNSSAGSGSENGGRSALASRERRRRRRPQRRTQSESQTQTEPRTQFGMGSFSSWIGHHARDYDTRHRTHHTVRNSVRDLVRSAVTSEDPDRANIVQNVLEGCKQNCRDVGVTFGEILAEDMDGLGVPPLVYEIISCWEDPALLQFLLENTPAKKVEMFVRRGCVMRGDNNMFQALRSALAANETVDIVPYDLTVREDDSKIHLVGTLDKMPELLSRIRTPPNERKRPLPSPVEWIAAGRLWCIEPTNRDSLLLRLVEGDPVQLVDADLTIVAKDAPSTSGRKNSMAVSMMKDKSLPITLVPLSQSGTNNILFVPFSPMEDRLALPACLSADGALHFQLMLRFAPRSRSPDSEEDEDWERVAKEEEWVLASWSGKDGETHL